MNAGQRRALGGHRWRKTRTLASAADRRDASGISLLTRNIIRDVAAGSGRWRAAFCGAISCSVELWCV